MQFVSTLTEEEQVQEILTFLREYMPISVPKDILPADFDSKIEALEESVDSEKILSYILSLRSVLVRLPTSHKSTPTTIQRLVLLLLPLLKQLDDQKNKQVEGFVNQISDIIDQSDFPLSIKVNSYDYLLIILQSAPYLLYL
jgi:hypothetical protein